jgi:polyhydroxyalkanoate synthesis regulator phasin
MVDKPQSNDAAPPPAPGTPAAGTPAPGTPAAGTPAVQRRGPGHRGADMRDTVAEMAERAQLISQEAGSKVAAAMKDVISAGAGIAGFAIESARDLVQYMVRRGQMTPEEADKLIKEAEAAHDKRAPSEKQRPTASKIAADRAAAAKVEAAARAAAQAAAMPPFRAAVRPVIPPASSSNGIKAKSPAPTAPGGAVKTAKSAKTIKTEKAAKPSAKPSAKPAAKSPGTAAKPKPSKAATTKPAKKKGGKR